MKKYFLLLFVGSLIFVSCDASKNNSNFALNFYFLQSGSDSNDNEEVEKISVDFSGISENLHSVLAYKEKKETANSLFNFALSEEAKKDGWKEIPSSKKVEIEKGKKLDLSLGGVVSLGEKKIDTTTNLTLVSVMGSEDKVKNFKYLALSLSSTKNGKLKIESSDLQKLKGKEVKFEKSYADFKKEAVVVSALQGKTVATDKEVNDYSTKGKEPEKPTEPALKDAPTFANQVGDEKLKISWNAIEGVEKYKVYYGASANCDKTKKDSCTTKEQTGTSLTLDSLTNGTEYAFLVVGLDSDGKEVTKLSNEELMSPKTKVGFFITSEGSVTTAGRETRAGFSGGNLGGLAGADAQCKKLADAAGLGGRTWKAFLFTDTVDPHNRIGTGPWYNIEKTKIGDNVQALKDQKSTLAFLNLLKDEKGNNLTGFTHDIMIGTQSKNCSNWTDGTGGADLGAVGHASNHNADVDNNNNDWLTGNQHTAGGGRGGAPGQCNPAGIKREWGLGKFYCFASDSNPQDF